MVLSPKFYDLDQQALMMRIAAVDGDGQDPVTVNLLPFDPTQAPDSITATQVIAPNYLDNSDFDYSKSGYTGAGGGTDADHECYGWFRQRFIKVTDAVISGAPTATVNAASGPFKAAYTYPMDFVLLNGAAGGEALTGTLTRVSDTQATLSANAQNNIPSGGVLWFGETLAESSANAVKGSSHSLYAAGEGANGVIPRWDKTNGWIEAGSDTDDRYDIAQPLSLNFARPGLIYYFRCIVKKRPGATDGDPVRLSVGIWDATSTEKRFLEGTNMTLNVVPVGSAGSTTYSYVVLADLDDGTTAMSDVVTITNGNAVLSESNYNRLTWENAPGVLRFRIYREKAGVVKRVFTITNGGQAYNDYGTDEGETPSSLPTAGILRPVAYTTSNPFAPPESWTSVLLAFEIPSTYDTTQTTGKQWIRIGVEGEAGDERILLIDRMMLSTSNGGWQRSSNDLSRIQTQNPSSLPTSSDQGDTGIRDDRLPACFPLDTPVWVCEIDGTNVRAVPIGELERGMFVLSGDRHINRIDDTIEGVSKTLVSVELSNGIAFRCTPSERFITSRADRSGTQINHLTVGDEILCWVNGRVQRATIESYEQADERVPIRTLTLSPGKTFIVGGGAIAHNLKVLLD